MNRKIGAVLGIAVVLVFGAIIVSTDWNGFGPDYADTVPDDGIAFHPEEGGELSDNSLNFQLFEEYYGVFLILGVLMFGAMIAGVCISREEEDDEE